MRKTIRMNSATIRAKITPAPTPSRLASSMRTPTPGLAVIMPNADAMPDSPNSTDDADRQPDRTA